MSLKEENGNAIVVVIEMEADIATATMVDAETVETAKPEAAEAPPT
jgi:hypothetical protein